MVRPCPELAGDSKPMDKARGLQPSDVVHEDNSSVVKAKVEVFKEFDLNLFSLETQRHDRELISVFETQRFAKLLHLSFISRVRSASAFITVP